MKAAWIRALMLLLLLGQSHAQESIEVIEVVGQTPLGAGVDIDKIASNVQTVSGEDMREQHALDMADYMKRNLASVFVNEAQANPLQPDVQYRGFVGSPLLGLPQGIAVYQDGVRVNEPFGDTVNWALIPDSAIEATYLMPGSNPLFGLNALGGAIAIKTKNGFTSPGSRAEFYGGSFGRRSIEVDTGGSASDRFGYFLTGSYLEEDGWRDYSPTEAFRLFGNLGWRMTVTKIDLSLTLADTDLIGNGPVPIELLELDRKAIFTRPDITRNELALVNLMAEREISAALTVTGNLYVRNSDIGTLNGDDSDVEECAATPGFVCEIEGDEERVIFDQGGNPVPASDAVEGAAINRSNTGQRSFGLGLQASRTGRLAGRNNLFVLGTSFDHSNVDFDASTELGQLDASRLAIPSGYFVGDSFTRLRTDLSSFSIYLSNTYALSDTVSVTVSGRYNDINVTLRDQIGTALDGDHNFHRFNPAIGITAQLGKDLTYYAGFSESSRAPSPVELTCADEDDPCRLPNAFLGDPPLAQVVAQTYETGFRGHWNSVSWHAGVFRTTNRDDILFISAGALTNQGFFDNVGRTRRDGLEFNLEGQAGDSVDWSLNYTWLDASLLETLTFTSPNNPAAVDGEVMVRPGDRLPLIPRQLLKAGMRLGVGDRVTLGGDVIAGGDFHMRGDEGNDVARIGEYAVLNLRGDYQVNDAMRVFLNFDNVLDEEFETFGLFGEPREVLGDAYQDSRFISPAAPRAAWLGVELTF